MGAKKSVGMFFLGFFANLIIVGGGIAIAMAVVTPKTVSSWTNTDVNQIVTEEYQNKNGYQLIQAFASGQVDTNNLGGLNSFSPLVGKTIGDINKTLTENVGFAFDTEELYTINWANMANYVMTSFQNGITIAGAVHINPETETNRTLLYLAYPEKEDGTFDYSNPRAVMDIVNNIDPIINNAKLGDLIKDDGSSLIITSILARNPKVKDLGTTLNDMMIGELIAIKEDSPTILKSMATVKVQDLEAKFKAITFGDVFTPEEIAANRFLRAIPSDTLITNLGAAINDIKVIDAFEEQIWPLGRPEDPSQYIAKMDSTWKYLLLDNGEASTAYLEYTIGNDMSTLISNMKANMSKATINQLIDDGFATVEQSIRDGFLSQKSMKENTHAEFINPTGEKYGELCVTDFIKRLSWFMGNVVPV